MFGCTFFFLSQSEARVAAMIKWRCVPRAAHHWAPLLRERVRPIARTARLSKTIATLLASQCEAGFAGSTASTYTFNANKMGLDDQNYVLTQALDSATIAARNEQLQSDMAPSVHRYNMFWSSFESSGTPSSSSPVTCDSGYYMVPPDSSGLKVNGGKYNNYRCISYGQEVLTQELLQADEAIGWESAAIIWCAPVYARDPACAGQPEVATESAPDNYTDTYANFTITQTAVSATIAAQLPTLVLPPQVLENSTQGNVAAESALDSSGCSCVPADAFMPDFQDFIAYLGDRVNNGAARFGHYIIWNECANSYWTDVSPRIDVTQVVTAEGQQIWVNTYANMIKLAQAVVQQPALVYVSTDRWWGVPPVLTSWNIGRAHMGTQNLLVGLWEVLGIETEWSLVMHVYGDIGSNEMDMQNGIVNAYDQVDTLAWMSWFDFQLGSVADDWSLVPSGIDPDLDNGQSSVTYQAMIASNPAKWGVDSSNYCCANVNVGCPA
ncbi:hypothetical protein WJX79_009377 [Trebouxia sp. C0005]